jgi:hypothetical protein
MVVMERFFLPEGIFIFTDTRTFVKILIGYIKYGCECYCNDLVLLNLAIILDELVKSPI